LEDVCRIIERQTDQLIALVDDLLDVTRITRGTFQLRKHRIRLSEVVEIAVESSRALIDKQQHALTVELLQPELVVEADPNRLAQVISNLLNNAAKYTPARGRIWLTASRDGNDLVLSIRDTGAGIPDHMLDRIFEMFSQVRSEDRQAGLGVGLTLAKQLVEMHGGTIQARSEGAAKGSEFVVRVPIVVDEPAEPSASPKPAQNATHLRVLVVDDNRDASTMLTNLVKDLGSEVLTACDGLQAIKYAADFRPHIVFMDIGMPEMDGYEAAKHIRLQTWGKDLTLVALTGWGQDEDRQRTQRAGFDHHLVKPVTLANLQELLGQAATKSS
jgi:CheY-like chemotaxis protein